MLLETAIELFVEYLKLIQRSNKTIKSYTSLLQSFNAYTNNYYNRPVYIEEIKLDDVEKYLFTELKEVKYSSSHRNNMVTAFKSLCNFCTDKGHISINTKNLLNTLKYIRKRGHM